jgi:putative ABC transport system permease protein
VILWRFSLREIRSRPGRALLTLLSIVLGVASVVAVTLATGAARQAFQDLFAAVAGKADLVVTSDAPGGFDESVVADLDKVPGLASVVPSVQAPTRIYGKNASGEDVHATLQAMGVDPERDSAVREYELTAGRYFEKEGEGVLDAGFAQNIGLEVGQKVRLASSHSIKRTEFEIVGTVKLKGAAGMAQAGIIFLPLPQAQRMFRMKDKVEAVHLVIEKGKDRHEVQKAAAAVLPPDLILDVPANSSQTAEESMAGPEIGLFIASTMSMLVAVFIILNTFFINVSERRRQIAILRAIGATRTQVLVLLMSEGLLLGVIGTILGIGAGLLGAFFLTRAMGELFQATLPAVQFAYTPFILAGVFGITMSLVATYLPARKAGMVSPLEGMGGNVQSDSASERGNYLWIGIGLFVVGGSFMALVVTDNVPAGMLNVVGFLFGLFGAADTVSAEIVISLVGTIFQLIGGVFILRESLRPLVAVAAAVLSPLVRVEGRLGRQQLLRRRTRTALTIGVLFMAVSTGIGMGSTLLDNVRDVKNWYKKTIIGDFFVRVMMPDNTNIETADIPDGVREEIEKIPGVKRIGAAKFVRVRVFKPGPETDQPAEGDKGEQVAVIAREFGIHDKALLDLKDTLKFDSEGKPRVDKQGKALVGSADAVLARERLLAGDVIISTVLAERIKLRTGDEILMAAEGGTRTLRIAGTANDYILSGLVIYMDRGTAKEMLGIEGASALVVDAEKSEYASVESALKKICLENGILLQSQAEINATIDGMMNGVVACQWVIIVMAFCVSGFGMVNTLTMNVLEQTRELGLLRIVAMTRWQVRKLILAQATMIGVIGLVPGIFTGLGMAWFINYSTLEVTGHPIEFETRPFFLIGSFFAGLVIVLIAASFPAERAARLDLATALQYE